MLGLHESLNLNATVGQQITRDICVPVSSCCKRRIEGLDFPTDTPETIARDIEIIKKELPIDILEFLCLTPLPGSEDHKILHARGVPMDPDMNNYDLEHACTAHPRMSKKTWPQVYADAWTRYYSDEHVETIMRRAVASRLSRRKIRDVLTTFSGSVRIEGVHPRKTD
jgi:hypothetical protein